MYPEKPWKNISKGAILCIQHFLVVQHDARYTVDQALLDPWLRDTQCLVDIARLEEEANITRRRKNNLKIQINLGRCTVAHKSFRSGRKFCGE